MTGLVKHCGLLAFLCFGRELRIFGIGRQQKLFPRALYSDQPKVGFRACRFTCFAGRKTVMFLADNKILRNRLFDIAANEYRSNHNWIIGHPNLGMVDGSAVLGHTDLCRGITVFGIAVSN